MPDEVQELILKVQGQLELNALNLKLKEEAGLLAEAILKLKQAGGSHAGLEAEVQKLGTSTLALNKQLAAMGTHATGFSGQGGLQMSYVLDDLLNTTGKWEHKLAAISNNLPGLAMSLGAGAGLAGSLGLIGTALISIAPLAHKAWEALSSDVPAEAMEKVAAAAKKVQAELEKILASRTPGAEDTQAGFEQFFAGQGAALQGGIAGALGTSGRGAKMTEAEIGATPSDAQIEAMVDKDIRYQGQGKAGAATQKAALKAQRDKNLAAAQERINQANVGQAGELLGKAPTDKGARQTIAALARANPGAFPRGFAADFASMEPEAMAQADQAAEGFDAANRDFRANKDARREAASRAAKEAAAKAKHEREVKDAEANAAAGARDMDLANQRDAKKGEADAQRNQRRADLNAKALARARAEQGKKERLEGMSNWFQGNVGANQEQGDAMAQATQRGLEQGLSLGQASLKAYTDMVARINQINAQMEQLQGAFQAGMAADNRQFGGQAFSFQSPMPGGG
jgi:hypothetical protein